MISLDAPTMRAARWLFHQVTVKDYEWNPQSAGRGAVADLASARRYLARFGDALNVTGKTALDVGCGNGHLCFELARRGAQRVVGADIGGEKALRNLAQERPEIQQRVEILKTDGTLRELGDERFDLVFSKDSFEHFSDPERVVEAMVGAVRPGGQLVIGFGPLWKGPTGGHIDFMTKLPWAHLLFPEPVIMAERRRFRPDEDARRFEEIKGGLNRMTLDRFERIMAGTGLRCSHFATNVSDSPVVRTMAVLRRIGPLREYFTANVYSVWTKPAVS
jgi:SAM-dependent methyltransferase